MIEFETLLVRLKRIIKDNIYIEDDRIYLKNKTKYEVFNLVEEYDGKFINDLLKELKVIEYEEEK